MEMLEILNQDGKKIGISKSKESVHADGDWHRAAHTWFINSAGELLIQRRSKTKINHPNQWDVSAAGHVSEGENSETSALREIEEEVGMRLNKSQLQHLGSVVQQSVLNEGTYINNGHNDVYLVEMDFKIEELTLQKDEVGEVRYIPWREFKSWVDEERKDVVPHPEEYSLLFSFLSKHY